MQRGQAAFTAPACKCHHQLIMSGFKSHLDEAVRGERLAGALSARCAIKAREWRQRAYSIFAQASVWYWDCRQRALSEPGCAGGTCRTLNAPLPLGERISADRGSRSSPEIEQEMSNLLIHYGDFTLAVAETDCSASTIRRSEALWPSGGFASWQKPGPL